MTKLKPCPFCGMTVHWKDGCGIVHDKVVVTCIVDLVCPTESNMHIPKEMWIKKWNMRTGLIPIFSRKEKVDLKPCPFCGSKNVSDNYDSGYFWVECKDCKVNGPESYEDYDKCLELWNRRVNE